MFDIAALDSARLLDHCLSKAQLAILSELFDSVKADESQKALALAVLGCVDAEKKQKLEETEESKSEEDLEAKKEKVLRDFFKSLDLQEIYRLNIALTHSKTSMLARLFSSE